MAWVAGVDLGEPVDAGSEVVVGGGPVDKPPTCAGSIAGGIAPPPVELRQVGVFEADEVEFGGARRRELVVIAVFLTLEATATASAEALSNGDGDGEQDDQPAAAAVHDLYSIALPWVRSLLRSIRFVKNDLTSYTVWHLVFVAQL